MWVFHALELTSVRLMPVHQKPPFQEFQQILGFLASIGLATTATSAFSLVGATSLFGDTSPEALSQLKQSALFLSWASACFIVALVFIIAPQLLYTELVIVEIIMHKEIPGLSRRFIRVAMGSFAWIPLGFQMAALYLLIQAMEAFSPGPVKLARYGMTSGAVVVIFVTLVAIFSEVKGRQKILGVVSGGTLTICEGCHKVVSTQGVRHRCSVSL